MGHNALAKAATRAGKKSAFMKIYYFACNFSHKDSSKRIKYINHNLQLFDGTVAITILWSF